MTTDDLRYAGFWPRLGALLLDFVILLPLHALVFWGMTTSRRFTIASFLPLGLFGIYYGIYLVRRYGGTPGKLIVGIRIRKLSGAPVGWREAILRALPAQLLGLLASVALLVAILKMTDAEYDASGFLARSARINALLPVWHRPVQWIQNLWNWGELVVLLTNRKRRALHDFIAGTVVVHAAGPAPAVREAIDRTVDEGIGD